jgi:hypothetical protein
MANENDQDQQKAAESARARASADDMSAKEAKRMADALRRLTENVDTIKKSLNKLDTGLKDGTKRAVDLGPVLAGLRNSLADLDDVNEEDRKAIEKNIKAKEGEYKAALASQFAWNVAGAALSKSVGAVAGGLKSLASSYQGNSSAFQTSADLIGVAADAVNGTGQAIAQGFQVAGQGLMMTGKAGMRAGVVLELLGVGLSAFMHGLSDATKFGVQFLAREIDNTIKTFNQASAAGALFAGGMTEFRNAAAEAMLTPEEFSKVIADNTVALSMYGGTVSNGVAQFTKINNAMGTYRKELLNLGLTTEEIAAGQAGYMEMVAISGQAQRRDYAALAKETRDYLVNLRAIADLTGENVKSAEDRARSASLEGDILSELVGMSSDATEFAKNQANFKNAIKIIGPEFETMFKQVFKYKAPQGEEAIAYANLPAMQEIMRRAESYIRAGMDPKELKDRLTADYKELGGALKEQGLNLSRVIGPASRLGNEYNKVMQLGAAAGLRGIKSTNLTEDADKELAEQAAKTGDALTNNVSAATDALVKFKAGLLESLNPGIESFAKITKNALIEIGDVLEKISPGSAARARAAAEKMPGGGGGGGTPSAKPPAEPTLLDKAFGTGNAVGSLYESVMEKGTGLISNIFETASTESKLRNSPGAKLLNFDGSPTGNQTHFDMLNEVMRSKFLDMVAEYGKPITVTSGARTPEDQLRLYNQWIAAGGGPNTPTAGGITTPTKPGTWDSHVVGKAMDISKTDFAQLQAKGLLEKYGFQTIASDPGHLQMLGKGGITDGVSIAGEAGPEAVIPLPDGRTIPVKMDMGELISKVQELIDISKEHADTSDKMLRASA